MRPGVSKGRQLHWPGVMLTCKRKEKLVFRAASQVVVLVNGEEIQFDNTVAKAALKYFVKALGDTELTRKDD